jgi:hypothetical protein
MKLKSPAVAVPVLLIGCICGSANSADYVANISTERPLGQYCVVDPNKPLRGLLEEFPVQNRPVEAVQPFSELLILQGNVRIPQGRALCLGLGNASDAPLGDLSPLSTLRPEDVDDVLVFRPLDLHSARQLTRFTKLRRLRLTSFERDLDTPEGHAELSKFQNLECFSMESFKGNVFGDDDLLKKLAGIKTMKSVWMQSEKVSDAGLESFRNHPTMEAICLNPTPNHLSLTDRSLRVLQSWPNLRRCIVITKGKITEEVVADFSRSKHLEYFYLTTSRPIHLVPPLQEAIPNCEVHIGWLDAPGEPFDAGNAGTFVPLPVLIPKRGPQER